MKIHVIGNSHVNTFSGYPYLSREESKYSFFKLYHLGPATAKYMNVKYGDQIKEMLKDVNKETDYILPVAGEVDCRFHIPLQADRLKFDDATMTGEFMYEYMQVFKMLHWQGYKTIMFGCHPSTNDPHDMSDLSSPVYGSPERRYKIEQYWNNLLVRESNKKMIPYFDIFYELKNKNAITTKMEYYIDYCHLNSEMVMPLIIEKLKKINIL